MSATWDSKSTKGTPVSLDEVLIIDTEDGRNQKRATLNSFGAGVWSRLGSDIFPTTLTDNVGIGTSTPTEKLTLDGGNFLQIPIEPKLAGFLEDAVNLEGASNVYILGKYAYVTALINDSLSIVDVTEPTNPVLIGTLQDGTNMNNPTDVFVAGRYAYVTSVVGDSLAVIDITDPSNPVLTGVLFDNVHLNGDVDIDVSGKYAYTVSGNSDSLAVIDIADPTNPVLVGSLIDGTNLNAARGVYISGKFAYVASFLSDSLSVIDVSDPTNPVLVGSLLDGTNLDGADDVYVSGRYAYVVAVDSLAVVDVSDPANPTFVGSVVDAINLDEAIDLFVSGKFAYVVSQSNDSLSVIDVSDPTNPVIVGTLKDSTNMNDTTGVHVSGKYAYVTAQFSDTLSVIDISGIDAPSASIGNIEAGYLSVLDNAVISNNLFCNGLNVANDVLVGGDVGITGSLDMVNSLINNVLDPVSAQDAATKNYVDTSTANDIWTKSGTDIFQTTLTDKVGIGTSSPNEKLHVLSSANSVYNSAATRGILISNETGPRLVLEDTLESTDDKTFLIKNQDQLLSFSSINDSGSTFVTDPIMALTRDGNVGIGTTPSEKLEVLGNVFANEGSLNSTNIVTTGQPVFQEMTNDANQVLQLKFTQEAISNVPADIWQFRSGGPSSASIGFFGQDTTPALFINFSALGRVGIGTSTPSTLLTLGLDNNADLLRFDSERAWIFGAGSTGSSTFLTLRPDIDGKVFKIVSEDQTNEIIEFNPENVAADATIIMLPDDGKVGIGILVPTTTLHVDGDVKITSTLDMTSQLINNVLDPVSLQDAATKNYVDTHSENAIWTKSGTNIFPTTLTDNVGLGTITPTELLQVEDGNIFTLDGELIVETTGTVGQRSYFTSVASTGATMQLRYVYDTVGDIPADVWQIRLMGTADQPLVISRFDNLIMAIDEQGSVGIGTSTPAALLDVDGTAKIANTLDMTSTQINNLADPTLAQDGATKNYVDTHSANAIWTKSGTDVFLSTLTDSVGIGTATPSEALEVLGNVLATDGSLNSTNIATTGQPVFLDVRNDVNDVLQLKFTQDTIGSVPADIWQFRTGGSGADIPIAFYKLDNTPLLFIDSDNENIGLNTNAPDVLAALDIVSTTKGFLAPRMTTIQKDAISSPPTSLVLHDTETNTMDRYSGTEWRRFGTQGVTTTEIWRLSDFPSPSVLTVTLSSGLSIFRDSLTTVFDFDFGASQSILFDGVDKRNISFTYAGTDTFFVADTNTSWDVKDIGIVCSGNGAQIFDITGGTLNVNSSAFTMSGTTPTIGTIEQISLGFMRDLTFTGYQTGLTILNAGLILEDTIFNSNFQDTGASVNVTGNFNQIVEIDTCPVIVGDNGAAFFISPAISGTVSIKDCLVPRSQFFLTAPTGTFSAASDEGETHAVVSVSDGITNAIFAITGGFTNVIDEDTIVHTGFSESTYNGTFTIFNIAGSAYEVKDRITETPVAFVAGDTGSGTTSLTRFTSTAHGLSATDDVLVTSTLYNEVGSDIRGTPLTNSFDLKVAFNGTDSGIWEVDKFQFLDAVDQSLSATITSVETVSFGARFVASGGIPAGYNDDDKVTHTGFTVGSYNGTFVISNVQSNSYDVIRQTAQFSVTDTGSSTDDITRFGILAHGLSVGGGIQLESTLYNGGGRVRGVLNNSVDVSIPFNGDDSGVANVNSLTQTDPRVTVVDSIGSPNSKITGELHLEEVASPVVVTISATDTPVLIDTTLWTSASLERTIASTAGVLTFKGLTETSLLINFSTLFEKLTGGATEIGVGLFKNGAAITDFVYPRSVNAGVIQISGTRTISMDTDDTLEMVVINFGDTNNIEVSQADMIISEAP